MSRSGATALGQLVVDGSVKLASRAQLGGQPPGDQAINLDGGGSATLVHQGHLPNRPYSNYDRPAPERAPIVTALLFDPA